MILLLAIADLHSGSTVSLCPPHTPLVTAAPPRLTDHHPHRRPRADGGGRGLVPFAHTYPGI